MPVIAIAGNTGAGKTTLAYQLGERLRGEVVEESVNDNPFLPRFGKDRARWGFTLQMHFLEKRWIAHEGAMQKKSCLTLLDRTLYEGAEIFVPSLVEAGELDHEEAALYGRLYDRVIRDVDPPDLLVYLRRDPDLVVRQIQNRARGYESKFNLNWVLAMHERYERWFSGYSLGPKLLIDANGFDFIAEPTHADSVASQLRHYMVGC